MSPIIITTSARADQEESLEALAARWPQFSTPELRRLRFLVYRRATGRLRPPAPVPVVVERLATEIAAYLRMPPPLPTPSPLRTLPPPLQRATTLGVPPSWRAWAAAHAPTPPRAPS